MWGGKVLDTVLECENVLRDNLEVAEKLLEEFRSARKEWNGHSHGIILIIPKTFLNEKYFWSFKNNYSINKPSKTEPFKILKPN